MVSSVTERIDFELLRKLSWHVGEKPVKYQTALDTSLTM